MRELENQKEAQTKIDVQVNQKERGNVSVSVTCNGSKLTKADSGRASEFTDELFISTKISFVEHVPTIEASVSEKHGSKLTKADAGRMES